MRLAEHWNRLAREVLVSILEDIQNFAGRGSEPLILTVGYPRPSSDPDICKT